MPHRREDENVSTDSLHEVKADLLESIAYQKSPSGRQSTKVVKTSLQMDQAETDAIQTFTSLRYSDLIYLLNILKLQRSKKNDL